MKPLGWASLERYSAVAYYYNQMTQKMPLTALKENPR
jgi:hypothetical protein